MPYKFGVYDLLVLPPSFPYGGMVRYFYALKAKFSSTLKENACLTFVTPS
jgi:leukotriene-A4 hydrolase